MVEPEQEKRRCAPAKGRIIDRHQQDAWVPFRAFNQNVGNIPEAVLTSGLLGASHGALKPRGKVRHGFICRRRHHAGLKGVSNLVAKGYQKGDRNLWKFEFIGLMDFS
ncbi:hypothetical protein [Mesoterricola sediminis]|uniref:hypothetical protein n=1 Tax=Mesoterricola sediminis TaxID=2927980 RepID=UPI0029315239|nr:hypothetical protein [Mesoterricola sediminis]